MLAEMGRLISPTPLKLPLRATLEPANSSTYLKARCSISVDVAATESDFCVDTDVSLPTFAPSLTLTLNVSKPVATPGDTLTYTATLTNTGVTLSVKGTISVRNPNSSTATLASWYDFLSVDPKGRCGDADEDRSGHDKNHWTPIAGAAGAQSGHKPSESAPVSTGETFSATPVKASGVTYATGADTITGTTIARDATALWNFTASVPLSPSQAAALFKGSVAYPIRESFHAEPAAGESGNSNVATVSADNAGITLAFGGKDNHVPSDRVFTDNGVVLVPVNAWGPFGFSAVFHDATNLLEVTR